MNGQEQRDKHAEVYREEAFELLGELETALMELEDHPGDMELISRVFRAMHTIKGSGAMFGFDEVAAFTHDIENVFDLVRKGKMSVTTELIDLTLAARDQIRLMLKRPEEQEEPVDEAISLRILNGLRALVPAGAFEEEVKTEEEIVAAYRKEPEQVEGATYRIRFIPPQDIFLRGINPQAIFDELHALGTAHIIAHIKSLPLLDEMNPELCYISWDIILTTSQGIEAIRDAFIFVEDDSEISIDLIDEGGTLTEELDYKRLGEILVERGEVSLEDINRLLGTRLKLGEMLVDKGLVRARSVESALEEQEHVKTLRMERWSREEASSIRVASNKLDKLVDLVGELVTVRARLMQLAMENPESNLTSVAEEVERLTTELHENTMSIRMVPIGTTFSKFRRLVRDLSRELGRDVAMSTSGGETELDKTVIERLNDPLVHIIRNSLDHGIEPPDVREAAGKPKQGTIHLAASHSGPNVVIEISDDGAGLDPGVIRAKAIDMGLISAEGGLSDDELFDLIFAPGFSTARKVTGVSGRGVGMDVVRQGIDSLRGTVALHSKKGVGTTVSLTIPLTLAIVEGLLVKISDSFYVFPLSVVEECVELTRADRESAHGRHLVNVRGEMIPYIDLRERFLFNGSRPEMQQVVILNSEGFRVGFLVDQVIGGHQTVIKTLGRVYREAQGFSGATILGDGTVALILDVPKLIEGAELDESESLRAGGPARSAQAEASADSEEMPADEEVPGEE